MKNFIFKSEADFHKMIFNKLDVLLAEQRHQRRDLAEISRIQRKGLHDRNLQEQVNKYFDEEDKEHIPEDDKEPD